MNVFNGELHLELRFDTNSEAFCLNNLLNSKIAQLEALGAEPIEIGRYERIQKLTNVILEEVIWCEVTQDWQHLDAATVAVLHSRPILDKSCETVMWLLHERVSNATAAEQQHGWEYAQAQAMLADIASITHEPV